VGTPHLDLFRVLDQGVVLYRTDPARPAADPAPAEVNDAARRLGVAPHDERILEGVRRAATFALGVSLTDLDADGRSGARGTRLDARVHPLGDGWVGVIVTPAASGDTSRKDPLTGLGNRLQFLELLQAGIAKHDGEEPVAGQGGVAAVLVDIDRLQEINDTLGHAQGDVLLRQTAARLRRLPFPTAEPCRMGSDEFGLVVELGPRRPEHIASQVAAAFSAPFVLGRLSVRSTASVGVAVAPEHGRRAEELLRSADVALSVAKGHRGSAVYHPDRDPFDLRRLQLLAGLRDAIFSGGLNLQYQPKLDLTTGRVAGVEALVRWHHDELGEIAPGEFVPLAEDRGLIGALSRWVLDESGRQCQTWSGHGFEIDVSANISAQNLYDPGLVRWLGRLFDEGGLAPGQLTLELTESQIVADLPMARQILRRLQSLGAKLSIDDFGTGYSSLSYLSKLPLDELKIDRSFVLDLEAGEQGRSVVHTIIGLGHDLGLRVVAEGVESNATVATLQSLGCDQVQGFHVSRPLAGDELESWLSAQTFAST
jgi:diguanylate cyclase (GGDEF)-like protein